MTMVCVQVMPEGVLKELESLTGVCKFQFEAAEASLRTHTSIVFGFAHIDSNKEQVNLLNIRFTLLGGSSILCQSHGTLLPAVIARPLTSVKVLLATLLTVRMRVGLVGAILCQVLLRVVGRHNCDVLASDIIAYFRPHH